MNWELLWESVKLPLRLFVIGLFSFVLSQVALFLSTKFGFELSDEAKNSITVWFTGIVGTAFTTLDKYVHEVRAAKSKKPLEGFARGLLPF